MNHTKFSQGPVSKQEWRIHLRQKAAGVGNVSHEVCQNLLKLLSQLKTDSDQKEYWAAYMAMPKEISVESLLVRVGLNSNKCQSVDQQKLAGVLGAEFINWVFPKVFQQDLKKDLENLGFEKAKAEMGGQKTGQGSGQKVKELHFFSPGSSGFVSGYAGILEPVTDGVGGALRVSLSQVKGVLVPGLGFDRQGVRLGHGQGFYDRTLQTYQGFKIGVTCEALLVDQLPSESTDVCMDYLVTEKTIYKLKA